MVHIKVKNLYSEESKSSKFFVYNSYYISLIGCQDQKLRSFLWIGIAELLAKGNWILRPIDSIIGDWATSDSTGDWAIDDFIGEPTDEPISG